MCECISNINDKIKDYNSILEVNLLAKEPRAILSTSRIKSFRDGKRSVIIEATYCPFCGGKYRDDGLIVS